MSSPCGDGAGLPSSLQWARHNCGDSSSIVPGMAWQSGMADMPVASSMAMPDICIDVAFVSPSSFGQAYIASAICENSKVTMRPPTIRRPHCVTMRRMETMVGCSLCWMCDNLPRIREPSQERSATMAHLPAGSPVAAHGRSPRAWLHFTGIQLVGAFRSRPLRERKHVQCDQVDHGDD